jgi:cytidylate kinase
MKRAFEHDIAPVLAALHTATVNPAHAEGGPHAPFVTISRQAGAGGRTLARHLAAHLNQTDPGELRWTVWDNELVERVATEFHLPASRVAALEEEEPSWLEEALGSLTLSDAGASELAVYHRVAATLRGLAEIGRVVIVGRGGGFVTADMPGGVHVRVVAPLEYRVAATAKAAGLATGAAAQLVREKDRAREAFYRRHWPKRPVTPESFTVTFNTATVTPDAFAASVAALIAHGGGAGAGAGTGSLKSSGTGTASG